MPGNEKGRLFYIGTNHFRLAPKPKLLNYINNGVIKLLNYVFNLFFFLNLVIIIIIILL